MIEPNFYEVSLSVKKEAKKRPPSGKKATIGVGMVFRDAGRHVLSTSFMPEDMFFFGNHLFGTIFIREQNILSPALYFVDGFATSFLVIFTFLPKNSVHIFMPCPFNNNSQISLWTMWSEMPL